MSTHIENDGDFRLALKRLTPPAKIGAGVAFIQRVEGLCRDERVSHLLSMLADGNREEEGVQSLQSRVRTLVIEYHARCGGVCDWSSQSAYYVARALQSLLEGIEGRGNGLWQTAMNCRMARTCASIQHEESDLHDESEQQYRIIENLPEGSLTI
ncbi:MAG: hypothetical protein HQL48_01675 [Gammaproteobacteria bacterium]|nr:hypothetical protein [Gammaproteobacteria bacterium]